jgi:AAA ATPase-like protein
VRGGLEDLSGLLGSVAAVRGGPPQHEAPRLRLLEGLTRLLRNLARESPLVIVLDDFHLADASSVDALGYLARNLAGSPVLVIATARPVELAGNELARETLLALEQDGLLRRLSLQPLGRTPMWPARWWPPDGWPKPLPISSAPQSRGTRRRSPRC